MVFFHKANILVDMWLLGVINARGTAGIPLQGTFEMRTCGIYLTPEKHHKEPVKDTE